MHLKFHVDIFVLVVLYKFFILIIFRISNSICTSSIGMNDALKHKEAPMVENEVVLAKSEVEERQKLSGTISIPKEVSFI